MPIRYTKPRRPATRPMPNFRGTTTELKEVQIKEIARAIGLAGGKLPPIQAKQELELFKKTIVGLSNIAPKNTKRLVMLRTKNGYVPIRFVKTRTGRIFIHQQPLTREITSMKFSSLLRTLEEGFKGGAGDNVIYSTTRKRRTGYIPKEVSKGNDIFAVEFMAEASQVKNHERDGTRLIRWDEVTDNMQKATPQQVVSVNIAIDPEISAAEKKQRMQYYLEQVKGRYGVPVKFIQ